ncbi:unnamed protein product [Hymenolepis diminuta]|uniref:Reverse transcriptase domain-containing protein n=1 Tax=Hymenolepis diminuta TaxID=6216 RepID=A0A0R3SDB9_HYMDI|nr:unnamed protein product [Hymenolepis diminuta]
MDTMVLAICDTATCLDDITVVGRSWQGLQECTIMLLQPNRKYGLRLQAEKCTFFVPCIKYLGRTFDKNDYHSDPEELWAITEIL